MRERKSLSSRPLGSALKGELDIFQRWSEGIRFFFHYISIPEGSCSQHHYIIEKHEFPVQVG